MKVLNKKLFSSGKVMKFVVVLLVVLMQFIFIPVPEARAATQVGLGTAGSFAVLAGAGITVAGGVNTTTISGDIGTHPTTTITGLGNIVLNGTNHAGDGVTQGAKTALTAAIVNAAGQGPTIPISADLGTMSPLTPGVYNSASTIGLTGTLTLNAQGNANAVWIFQAGTALTTASNSKIVLTNGAQACNVFWVLGSAATLGTTSTFIGTIMADTEAITDDGYSTITGRLLASTAAVTLDHTTINVPTCAAGTIGGPALSTAVPLSAAGAPTSAYCQDLSGQIVPPSIVESKRIDANSIFVSWGPFSGINLFNVQYGTENGKWLYNTDVTGFSTTINNLPANQPIWVRVAARNYCTIGNYGQSKLVGGPRLPNTGLAPLKSNTLLYAAVVLAGISVSLVLIQRKSRFLSKH